MLGQLNIVNLTKAAADSRFKLVLELVAANAQLLLAHWQAPTKTNEHAAIGELYEAIAGLTDTYAEALMGGAGSREFPTGVSCPFTPGTDAKKAVADMKAAVQSLLSASETEDLKNVAADMLGAVNKTLYKLS